MVSKDKIAILGASVYQLPLIRKASELGFETHVFAWQNDDPGEYEADYYYPISVTNRELILAECLRIKPKGIASISSDIAALTISQIAPILGLISNTEEAVKNAVNKIKTKNKLLEMGVKIPRFVEIDDSIPVVDFSYPLIVKPSDRSGCKGVKLANNRNELLSAINQAREISFERKAIIEEYLEYDLFTAECLSYRGKNEILSITKDIYIQNKNEFLPHEFIASDEFINLLDENRRELLHIIQKFNLSSGASNIEFFIDNEDDVVVLEISPCMHGEFVGSHLVNASTGYDYLKCVVDIACGNNVDYPSNRQPDEACVIINGKESCMISKGVKTILWSKV